jgi:hypothetical protein
MISFFLRVRFLLPVDAPTTLAIKRAEGHRLRYLSGVISVTSTINAFGLTCVFLLDMSMTRVLSTGGNLCHLC